MPSILQQAGATPQKQPKYVPLFIDRTFTGLYTQRNVLHDPSDIYTSRFYGGRPDALWMGRNVELTNRLTLQRRPGLTPFSAATYPTPPNRAFSFPLLDGTIQVIIDTGSTGNMAVTSADANSGGNTVYHGTFPGAAANAFVGMQVKITGFANAANNGTFVVAASSATTLTLVNPLGVAETISAVAISSGAVYVDNQDGTKTFLVAKSPGATQMYFVAVAGTLFMGDGMDTKKYTPGNPNGIIWNWGIVAPAQQPGVSIIESGASAVLWQPNTEWSTLGFVYDTTTNTTQQLNQVASNTHNSTALASTEFGLSGNGQPSWNQTPGGTTTDGSVTWTNRGPIVLWTANTIYNNATVGGTAVNPCIIYDPVTKACYINANPGLTQGTSGNVYPHFNAGVGQATHEGSVKWFYIGTPGIPGTWLPTHAYPAVGSVTNNDVVSSITEPVGLSAGLPTNQTVYWQVSGGGTSGSVAARPNFNSAAGQITGNGADGDLSWLCLGNGQWSAARAVSQWTGSGSLFTAIKDANGNMQACINGGVTASAVPGQVYNITSVDNASGGKTVYHGTFTSPTIPVGTSGTLPIVIAGFATSANNGTFNIVSATTTTITVTNAAGVAETIAATGTYNPWGTTYGDPTTDGSAIWTCVGRAITWAANTQWYLPPTGFAPPSPSQPYGGAAVIDSNNNVEFVINSGKGGGSAPSWAAVGSTTQDPNGSGALWFNLEPFTQQSLVWFKGHVYAYSFKSRSMVDFYSTPDPVTGALPVPPGLDNPLPTPTGSRTGAISTASPAFIITGANTGAVNTISGFGSTDPQVDTIVIWRDADGGGSDAMFELTEIPAPQAIGGIAQPWTFKDFLPDAPTNDFPGLNPLIPAPIDGQNDPPPATFRPMAYNFQRIWGADGSTVPFSGGPDVLTGNPNEAFQASDEFPFLAPVVSLVKTPQGLITFLTDSIELIAGGPLTSSFFPVTIGPGIGLMSYNMLDVFAGEIYFFSSDNQFRVMSPSLNIANAGFAVGDQLANLPSSGSSDATWNPATGYVAIHQNGIDNCMFLADGSTGWYRLNPRQVPGVQGPEPIWSPFATITGGARMVQSVETAPGIKKLLVGSTQPGQPILNRNLSVFTDNGTQYDAWFIMGSITLAHPGQLALVKFMEFDFSGVQYKPTISYLLNEISGSFTPFVTDPVFDPPSLYGATIVPSSYSPNRYYFGSNHQIARMRHMQVKVDFGTTSVGNELYDMTIFGRFVVET